MRFQTKLNIAAIALVIGVLGILSAILIPTARKFILYHYRDMAIDSAVLAGRYVNYILSAPDTNGSPVTVRDKTSWKKVVDLVARDLRVHNASIIDLNGNPLATAIPSRWVDKPALDREALAAWFPSSGKPGNNVLTMSTSGATIGLVTPIGPTNSDGARLLYLEYSLADGEQLVRWMVFSTLTLALVASVLAAGASTALSRSLAAPIERLEEGIRRLGQGELSARLDQQGSQELKNLAHTINEMAASLERYIVRLKAEMSWRESAENELRIAAQIQQALLPDTDSTDLDVDLAAHTRAAKTVGGDFYDLLDYGLGKTGLVIGDATGKGLPAALLATECSSILHALAMSHLPPDYMLGQANELLIDRIGSTCRFVTLYIAVLDIQSGSLCCASAGHPPPLLLRAETGEVLELRNQPRLPLGIGRDTQYVPLHLNLKPGDTLLLYSDGITEARRDDRFYGVDRLKDILRRRAGSSAQSVLAEIEQDLETFHESANSTDDATLVCLRFVTSRTAESSQRKYWPVSDLVSPQGPITSRHLTMRGNRQPQHE